MKRYRPLPATRWQRTRRARDWRDDHPQLASVSPAISVGGQRATTLEIPTIGRSWVPVLTLPTPRDLGRVLAAHWEMAFVASILLLAGLVHGINMFHFPYIEDDEGIYMSQAWSLVHQGQLAPYTYWYDHAPMGWALIALWSVLTGGFTSFGGAINSGHVLMLVLQLGSSLLLYGIVRRITGSPAIALIVTLLFALSPYGIYYHRRILLDNITTFWLLLSIWALVRKKDLSLGMVWLSALAFSMSILSKEITLVLFPAMASLVLFRAERFQRLFAGVGWLVLSSALLSLYGVMALLKGEMFPSGTLLGGSAPHVSLLGTIASQAARGKDGGLFDLHSAFWQMAHDWAWGGAVSGDPVLVVGGTLCAIFSVIMIRRHRLAGIMGLATLSLWLFLARGGLILGFYLVPLLPLLALNIGLAIDIVLKEARGWSVRLAQLQSSLAMAALPAAFALTLALTVVPTHGFTAPHVKSLWQSQQANAQAQALNWTISHLPRGSRIVIDDYMYTDLQDANKDYQIYWYWKVDPDPAIRDRVLHNDWRNVDYIITSPQMLYDAQSSPLPLVEQMVQHSTSLVSFETDYWKIDVRQIVRQPGMKLLITPIQSTPATISPPLPKHIIAKHPERRFVRKAVTTARKRV